MFAQKYVWLVIVVGSLFACAAPEVPKAHNDPSKYTVAEDVLWASPDGFDLTMDIYTPTSGQTSYPVLMIFHGGGWLINDKSIMDQMAQYVVTNGDYVVCNVDYRLLGDQDNTVTLDQIVGDVFGAVLWAKENIGKYQGNGKSKSWLDWSAVVAREEPADTLLKKLEVLRAKHNVKSASASHVVISAFVVRLWLFLQGLFSRPLGSNWHAAHW